MSKVSQFPLPLNGNNCEQLFKSIIFNNASEIVCALPTVRESS